jgi:hypothetical protein
LFTSTGRIQETEFSIQNSEISEINGAGVTEIDYHETDGQRQGELARRLEAGAGGRAGDRGRRQE